MYMSACWQAFVQIVMSLHFGFSWVEQGIRSCQDMVPIWEGMSGWQGVEHTVGTRRTRRFAIRVVAAAQQPTSWGQHASFGFYLVRFVPDFTSVVVANPCVTSVGENDDFDMIYVGWGGVWQ